MRLCRLDDEGYYPVKLPWEYGIDLYQNVKSRIFSFLDRDSKHAIICKITHRHKKSVKKIKVKTHEEIIRYSKFVPSDFPPWCCVRCGEKCELNLMIDIDYAPWTDWKDYCKMVDLPNLTTREIFQSGTYPTLDYLYPYGNKKPNNFWSNIL